MLNYLNYVNLFNLQLSLCNASHVFPFHFTCAQNSLKIRTSRRKKIAYMILLTFSTLITATMSFILISDVAQEFKPTKQSLQIQLVVAYWGCLFINYVFVGHIEQFKFFVDSLFQVEKVVACEC